LNTLLNTVRKKRHKNAHRYLESEDSPVVFSKGAGRISKNFYKVNKRLEVKKVEEKDVLAHKKKESLNLTLARSVNLGYYLIAPLLLGLFFGYWLDQLFHTKPFFLLTLFFLGIVGCFYNLLKMVRESSG